MKKAFLFPGQGAQYVGMGKDFVSSYAIARETLEEADDLLGRKLSDTILHGPHDLLTETKNSQLGIYVISIAIWRVVTHLFPHLTADYCAGLSLGEYTALTASGRLNFQDALSLVQYRGQYMNDACESVKGTMAVVLGLEPDVLESLVHEARLPNDLWIANYNCPGQIVISGTLKGIDAAAKLAKERGAKKILPLQVYGAFHSGLMEFAKKKLESHINEAPLCAGKSMLIMNVPGSAVKDDSAVRSYLIEQVTSPVKWEQGVRFMDAQGTSLYVEMGPGRTLSGFNKRILVSGKTVSIEKIEDLKNLEEV